MIKPRKAVIEMEKYNPPTSGRENYMRLDFNENTLGCSPIVIRRLRKISSSSFSIYPEYGNLRKALAKYCKVREDEVLPTNATDEAIKTIIETYIEKGKDEIVIPIPTFAMLKFYAQLNEAIIKEVVYNQDLSFPTKRIIDSISKKTKIVVLVNPNNPTGTSIKNQDIIKIIKKAEKNNALVLLDEAYYQFYGKTFVPLIRKYDNLIVIQTFSKAFGLAGIRLGYIVSNQENINAMQKVLSPYSVNGVAAICAQAALKDLNYVQKYVKEIKQSKEILYSALDRLGIKYYQSDANFILIDADKMADVFCKKLKENGILARNRSSDVLLEGCVRITIGTKRQTKRLVNILEIIIKQIRPLLIFDIDGVLVDVSQSYRVAIKKTAEYFTGNKASFEEIDGYKNKGGYNNDWDLTVAIIRSRGKNIEKRIIVSKFQSFYKKLAKSETWLLDKGVLRQLSGRYNLAILTGRPKVEALYALESNGAEKYFSDIIAMEDVSRQKPNPEGLIKLLNKFQADGAFYFGDTIDDMKAAASAKITPIGILTPQNKSKKSKNLLKKFGAKFVLNDISQIAKVLK